MSPPVVYESEAVKQAIAMPIEERRKMVTKIATQQGASAAAQAALVWTPAILYLANGNAGPCKWFQSRMNAQAKTAFWVMPILGIFGLVSEQVATHMANPGAFENEVASGRVSTLSPPKRFANFVLDHPIRVLIMVGVPAVLSLFLSKSGQKELSLSQKIMHTRVAGQFSVLATLVGTMAFHDYMSRRGRFLEPWEEEALKAKAAEQGH